MSMKTWRNRGRFGSKRYMPDIFSVAESWMGCEKLVDRLVATTLEEWIGERVDEEDDEPSYL